MRKPGTDLMATGVIVGSTALAVAATLAFTRSNSAETRDSAMGCTPHEAHWSVMYAVTVDGADVTSTPAGWHFRTGFQVPRASEGATHRCRHFTVVAPRMKLFTDRLSLSLGEAAERTSVEATRAEAARAEAAKEQAEALRTSLEAVRERLEAVRELAEERRHLRETVLKKLEANSARER